MMLIIKICRDFDGNTIFYFGNTIASFFRKYLKNIEVTYNNTIAIYDSYIISNRKKTC